MVSCQCCARFSGTNPSSADRSLRSVSTWSSSRASSAANCVAWSRRMIPARGPPRLGAAMMRRASSMRRLSSPMAGGMSTASPRIEPPRTARSSPSRSPIGIKRGSRLAPLRSGLMAWRRNASCKVRQARRFGSKTVISASFSGSLSTWRSNSPASVSAKETPAGIERTLGLSRSGRLAIAAVYQNRQPWKVRFRSTSSRCAGVETWYHSPSWRMP